MSVEPVQRWQEIKALALRALDLPEAERASFLDSACAGAPDLRRAVGRLIRGEDAKTDVLAPLIRARVAEFASHPDNRAMLDQRVGAYRLLEIIATGGMGVVYRAVRADGAFEQEVAVKLLRGELTDDAARRRFEQERRVLARLDHPYVARLIDGGATATGVPYLVMELVRGAPIHDYCDAAGLDLEARLALFSRVCSAVQYLHQNLVIHRDLKPGNILITADGAPRLVDFGIAKLIADAEPAAEHTRTDQRALTPRYASPEQIRGEALTTASDVYSLGVVLFELLTGVPPYRELETTPWRLAREISDGAVEPPSRVLLRTVRGARTDRRGERAAQRRLARRLRGDLDAIVLKALQPAPRYRYGTAQELADDLQRRRDGLTLRARPDTPLERVGRFVRRNRMFSAAVAAIGLAFVVAAAGLTYGFHRARVDSARAVQAAQDAERLNDFLRATLATANPYREGRPAQLLDLVRDAEERLAAGKPDPTLEMRVRLTLAESCTGLWEWALVRRHAQRARELLEALDQTNTPAYFDALRLCARAETFAGSDDAVHYAVSARVLAQRLFGELDRRTARAWAIQGFAFWSGGAARQDWEKAERSYRRGLETFAQAGVAPDALPLYSFACFLLADGRLDEAGAYFEQAVTAFERQAPQNDVYFVHCLRGFGIVRAQQGRSAEAELLFREALQRIPQTVTPSVARELHRRIVNAAFTQGCVTEIEHHGAAFVRCLVAEFGAKPVDGPMNDLACRLIDCPAEPPQARVANYAQALELLLASRDVFPGVFVQMIGRLARCADPDFAFSETIELCERVAELTGQYFELLPNEDDLVSGYAFPAH